MATLPALSVAVTFTVVTPTGKTDPDGGTATTVTGFEHGSTTGMVKFTAFDPHNPGVLLATMLAGHTSGGGVTSTTRTLKVQLAEFCIESVTVAVTIVSPSGKVDPSGGLNVIVSPVVSVEQLSRTVGSGY